MADNGFDLVQLTTDYPTLFITGTDTEVGKTYCTSLIVKDLVQKGVDVFPFKPIAAGTEYNSEFDQQLNEDALSLFEAVNRRYSLQQINPITYEPAIAPHIAAAQLNQSLTAEVLDQELGKIDDLGSCRLIEGAGGWLLPLNDKELLSDWVADHEIPVVMVVGIKLGCLNHALLTAEAIEQSDCELVGWIANFKDGESEIALENAKFLQQKLKAPLLFSVKSNQKAL